MIEINPEGNKALVRPQQNIVAAMVEDFRKELSLVLARGVTNMVIDLEGVEVVDSMGLSVLVATHNSLRKLDSRLEIINGADNIIKLLKEMRLDRHFVLAE